VWDELQGKICRTVFRCWECRHFVCTCAVPKYLITLCWWRVRWSDICYFVPVEEHFCFFACLLACLRKHTSELSQIFMGKYTTSVYNQASYVNSAFYLPWSLNWVLALIGWGKGGNFTSARWLCDPIWHMSSRSNEACLRSMWCVICLVLSLESFSRPPTNNGAGLLPLEQWLFWQVCMQQVMCEYS